MQNQPVQCVIISECIYDAGRANDYQAQLSRSLMSSLGAPVLPGLPGLLPGLPNPAEMLPLMYPGMLQSLSLLGTAGLLGKHTKSCH